MGIGLITQHQSHFTQGHPFCQELRPQAAPRGLVHLPGHEEGRDRNNALLGIPDTERPRLLSLLWELMRPAIAIGKSSQAAQETPASTESSVCPHALLQQAGPCTPSKGEIAKKTCFYLNIFLRNKPYCLCYFSVLCLFCCYTSSLGAQAQATRLPMLNSNKDGVVTTLTFEYISTCHAQKN